MMNTWRVGIPALLVLFVGCRGDSPVQPRVEVEGAGLVHELRSREVRYPSGVPVLLKADGSARVPLAGLSISRFEILENGEPISQFEAPRAFVPKPGKFVSRTSLVLDLSGR